MGVVSTSSSTADPWPPFSPPLLLLFVTCSISFVSFSHCKSAVSRMQMRKRAHTDCRIKPVRKKRACNYSTFAWATPFHLYHPPSTMNSLSSSFLFFTFFVHDTLRLSDYSVVLFICIALTLNTNLHFFIDTLFVQFFFLFNSLTMDVKINYFFGALIIIFGLYFTLLEISKL